jgi:osmoprotectant transport system substrate-binding protein
MNRKMHHRNVVSGIAILICLFLFTTTAAAAGKLIVGSKEFTEQRILGNIMIVLLEANGFETVDKTGLGGTLVARKALENDQIDIYMEYTGTGLITHLKHEDPITDPQKCYEVVKKEDLKKNDIVWLPYMDFNNTYCLLMRKEDAEKKGIQSLSDLADYVNQHPKEISFGLNAEFYARPDGYRPLQKAYGFKFPRNKIVKMQSGLLYKALKEGQIDVGLGFATDGRIKGFGLRVLTDDKNFFPVYNPAPCVKSKTAEKYPELTSIFEKLGDKLTTDEMTNLNYQVDIEHKDVKKAATEWLKGAGLI